MSGPEKSEWESLKSITALGGLSLHTVNEGSLFPPSSLSLWGELCRLLLMCFWQLNLISGLHVKETLDCSPSKNMLSLHSSTLFKMLPHDPSMTQFLEMVENKEEQCKTHWELKGEKIEGRGRRGEKDVVRLVTVSKSTCGKLTKIHFFPLLLSCIPLSLGALSGLPSWASPSCSLIGRETLGKITGISFHCSPVPLG